MTFPLRAVESVEKCSWECSREGTKSRPLIVRLAGGQSWLRLSVELRSELAAGRQSTRRPCNSTCLVVAEASDHTAASDVLGFGSDSYVLSVVFAVLAM